LLSLTSTERPVLRPTRQDNILEERYNSLRTKAYGYYVPSSQKKNNLIECNYEIHNKELLAIIRCLKE